MLFSKNQTTDKTLPTKRDSKTAGFGGFLVTFSAARKSLCPQAETPASLFARERRNGVAVVPLRRGEEKAASENAISATAAPSGRRTKNSVATGQNRRKTQEQSAKRFSLRKSETISLLARQKRNGFKDRPLCPQAETPASPFARERRNGVALVPPRRGAPPHQSSTMIPTASAR